MQKLGAGNRAIATFASKNHELFATVHGRLTAQNDRAVIDRLWNTYVAAWYEDGKDDPKLVLLRLLSALRSGKRDDAFCRDQTVVRRRSERRDKKKDAKVKLA